MYKIDRSKFVYAFHIEHMNKAGHVAAAPGTLAAALGAKVSLPNHSYILKS